MAKAPKKAKTSRRPSAKLKRRSSGSLSRGSRKRGGTTSLKRQRAAKGRKVRFRPPTDIKGIAQFIADRIVKGGNVSSGSTLPMDVLRSLLKPASEPKITSALLLLVDQGILIEQPGADGLPQYVVA
jgi:hypothetical protein